MYVSLCVCMHVCVCLCVPADVYLSFTLASLKKLRKHQFFSFASINYEPQGRELFVLLVKVLKKGKLLFIVSQRLRAAR